MKAPSRIVLSAIALALLAAPAPFTHAQGSPQCVPKPPGLVSWWRAEGDAADALGRNPGTAHEGVAYGPGMVGLAFHFNGSSFVSAATAGLPVGNADRTIELWANITTQPTHESYFAGYGRFGVFTGTYHVGTFSTRKAFFSQWGGQINGGPVFEGGQWHHVAVTNVGAQARLYVDGQEVAANTLPIVTPETETQFFIGRISGGLGDTRQLNGFVDEVSVYDRALSADEIRAIYEAGAAGKCLDATVVPMVLEPNYKGGKLTLSPAGATISGGAMLEDSGGTLASPESFPRALAKKGAKWLVKK
jgi:hypothetical protein